MPENQVERRGIEPRFAECDSAVVRGPLDPAQSGNAEESAQSAKSAVNDDDQSWISAPLPAPTDLEGQNRARVTELIYRRASDALHLPASDLRAMAQHIFASMLLHALNAPGTPIWTVCGVVGINGDKLDVEVNVHAPRGAEGVNHG